MLVVGVECAAESNICTWMQSRKEIPFVYLTAYKSAIIHILSNQPAGPVKSTSMSNLCIFRKQIQNMCIPQASNKSLGISLPPVYHYLISLFQVELYRANECLTAFNRVPTRIKH